MEITVTIINHRFRDILAQMSVGGRRYNVDRAYAGGPDQGKVEAEFVNRWQQHANEMSAVFTDARLDRAS